VCEAPAHASDSRDSVNLDLLRSLAVLMVLGVHLLLYFRIARLGPLPLLGMGQCARCGRRVD
jgi:peptidoglycan/LPS O-acetylase OafA/YrhL